MIGVQDSARAKRRRNSRQRIAIIGAGPIGLESALQAARAGLSFAVYEADGVAANVLRWGHVILFTPFSMNHSTAGLKTIAEHQTRDRPPEEHAMISGERFAHAYLQPLAQSAGLREHIHTGHRVIGISRADFLKGEGIGDSSRRSSPFRLLIETDNGKELLVEADVVIDASGTYGLPNRIGSGGIAAPGERRCGDLIRYGVDDIIGAHRGLYEGKRTLLIGAGYSAATSIVAFKTLLDSHPDTQVSWLTRSDRSAPIREIPDDRLAARKQLAEQANRIAADSNPRLRHIAGGYVERLEPTDRGTLIAHVRVGDGATSRLEVDRVLANVGYRPDNAIYRELQVHECYATQAPMRLATTLLANASIDCLDREATPAETLVNPEPDFFIVGAKSYGRDATFLMRTGIAQVQQVFSMLKEE